MKRFVFYYLFITLLFIGCSKTYNNSDDSETPKSKVVSVTEKIMEALSTIQGLNFSIRDYYE